jgi:hypothetical protein
MLPIWLSSKHVFFLASITNLWNSNIFASYSAGILCEILVRVRMLSPCLFIKRKCQALVPAKSFMCATNHLVTSQMIILVVIEMPLLLWSVFHFASHSSSGHFAACVRKECLFFSSTIINNNYIIMLLLNQRHMSKLWDFEVSV